MIRKPKQMVSEDDPDLLSHIRSLGLKTVAEYLGWCARNGFSRRTAKHWRVRMKERAFASRTIAEARKLATSSATRAPLVTQMGNQIQSEYEYRSAVDLLQHSVIGKVKEIHAWTSATFPQRGRPAGEDPVLREVPPYLLDTLRRRIAIAGNEVRLTDREFDLAAFLFRRHGRIVSRDTLLSQVWKLGTGVTTRTVDTHVSRLRRKLGLNGEHGWQLTAVYQHGYRLEPTADNR